MLYSSSNCGILLFFAIKIKNAVALIKITIFCNSFLPYSQLLSPNIQQKHYHVGGYLVDGNRHVSITYVCMIDLTAIVRDDLENEPSSL